MDTLVEAIERNREIIPDKIALRYKKDILTYRELQNKIELVSGYLESIGIEKGDRIILEALSKFDYVITFIAAQRVGAITIPIERAPKFEVLNHIYNLTEAKIYLSSNGKSVDRISAKSYKTVLEQAKLKQIRGAYKNPSPEDIGELIFTTGSTGKPKGTTHTLKGINCNMKNTWHGIGMLDTDIILLPLPLNHSFGMRVLRSALLIGATIVLQNGSVFIKETESNIESYSCTALACVSTAMEMMLQQIDETKVGDVFGRLRYIEFSAGAVPVQLRKKLLRLLPNTEIHNTWGSSESGGCLFLNLKECPDKIESMGKPLDNIQVCLIEQDNNKILEGIGEKVIGKMALKGDMQMIGYWGQEDLSKEILKDGWLIMSDLVWKDSDGYFYMIGRADDIINTAGEKVSPNEIETVVNQYLNVKESACVGVKDPDGVLGEIPIIYIVADKNLINLNSLKEYLAQKLSSYKIPSHFIFLDSLPRNAMGKIERKKLRKMWEDSKGIESLNPVLQNIFQRRSIRNFTNQSIPKDILELLIEAGKAAPSGKNLKTRRFTVIQSENEIRRLKEITKEILVREKKTLNGFENPKVLILISNDRRNQDGIQDSACSAENIMLSATSFGLGSVWLNGLMTICDIPEIRMKLDEYKIPKNHIVWAAIALGYPETTGIPPEEKGNVVCYIGEA